MQCLNKHEILYFKTSLELLTQVVNKMAWASLYIQLKLKIKLNSSTYQRTLALITKVQMFIAVQINWFALSLEQYHDH